MLKRYFIRPTTVDRIRASWLGDTIERYVARLTEQKYAARNVAFRVPVLVRFGEFAQRSGASKLDDLSAHIEPFIEDWLNRQKQAIFGIPAFHPRPRAPESTPAATPLDSPQPRQGDGRAGSVRRRGPWILRLPASRARSCAGSA